MTDTPLNEAELAALRALDTPTVCNAMEVLMPELRSWGFTTRPLVCAFPELGSMVGYARTGICRATRPSTRSKDAQRELLFAWYQHILDQPGPRIVVMQDGDGPLAGFGAFWGEVQTNLHTALGCVGLVTDGSVRDIPQAAPGFQLLAGSVSPSHAHVHLDAFGGDVTVAGMVVRPGDLIHADRHGACVIPHKIARDIPKAADLCARREAVMLKVFREPGFTLDKFRKAWGEADDIH